MYGEAVLGMEATGHYWYVPFRYLSSKGYRVYCLNPQKTKALRTLWGYDKTKTDDIDCLAIAEVLRIRRLDDSSPLDTELLGLKQLTRTRAMLMKFRKQAKMRLRNLLDQAFPEYETHFTNIFVKGSLAVLKRCPTPTRLLAEPFDDLLASVKEDIHKQFRKEKLEQIIESAKTSCGICFSDDYYELQIKLLVGQIEFLNEQIAQIDERLSGFVNERHSNLLTIPGLGSVALGKIVAEIGDVRRFKNISSLVSYAGLAPSLYQSGTSISGESHISKQGPSELRHTLYYAAVVAIRSEGRLKAYYQKKRAEGMHARKAFVVLSRKLLGIIYSMMKTGDVYKP